MVNSAPNTHAKIRGERRWKRLMDLAIAVPVLLVFSPLILAVAALVRIRLGAPVLFRQKRTGLGGELFELFKFRTMLPGDGTDEQRLTSFGLFLRKFSLDELPQLLNVIRGEMSLVGPRPLLPEYLPLYSPIQFRRHEVKPGITGWAQVNGRNAITWERKFEMDVWYVDHLAMTLDFKILRLTVLRIIRPSGVSAGGAVLTMERFRGSSATPGELQ